MTGTGDRLGDETTPTQIAELPVAERRVLAAVAVVGHASLSADELAALAEVEDIAPVVANLERRGLIKGEEKRRYSALGRVGEEIRKTDDFFATGERLLQYMTTLAKDGQLTPERLLDDAGAILGLTEWAAEWRRWEELLELVKTLQACFGIVSRVKEWCTLLNRALSAARALGDRRSEAWVLRQLATASTNAGDLSAAQRYLREARAVSVRSMTRIALWMLCSIAAVLAGGAAGYAIGDGSSNSSLSSTTKRVPVVVTVAGRTVRTSETVTLPTKTVFDTTTETLPAKTVFSTTTETVTVTVPAPPQTSSQSIE